MNKLFILSILFGHICLKSYGQLYPNSSTMNTVIEEDFSNSIRLSYPGYNNGYLRITSDGWLNFYTERSKFYFNKEVVFHNGISAYNADSLKITFDQGRFLRLVADSWLNFYTDRSAIFFDKSVVVRDGTFRSYDASDLILQTNDLTRLTVDNATGNVGIGITDPQARLHVEDGSIRVGTETADYGEFNYAGGGMHLLNRWASSSSYIRIGAGADSDLNTLFVLGNGTVGIGTQTTGSHKLAVEGSIGARKITVEPSGWSDFVFEQDYELRTLEEVEEHIQKNGHLPEIPNAEEVRENGIDLGEIDAKLLQKIEELTLYLIEQNKQNLAQQKRIEQLEQKINDLQE